MSCRKTVVMNTENLAVTEFTNYEFNSFCIFNGVYLGAKSDGIFVLDGADDNGTPINGSFQTATIDTKKQVERIPRDAWIVGRKAAMNLKAINDEGVGYTYSAPVVNAAVHEERVKIGRGIKGRSYNFVLTNTGGVYFNIDSLRVLVEPLTKAR